MVRAAVSRILTRNGKATWREFAASFIMVFFGGVAALYLFVLLVDPYDVVPFSLPLERRIVSISQRYMYPQIVRSGRFDSFIVGTSTSRLLDPEILNPLFHARFANLAMDSTTAWEQYTMAKYFFRKAGRPKVLVIGVDHVWCESEADRNRITFRGFPDWLYDDNPWNDYLYLLNSGTVEIAGRLVGYQLGLYRERVRYDGFEVFTPPEYRYDIDRARKNIWQERPSFIDPLVPPVTLSEQEARALPFPALQWMDEVLNDVPETTLKILAYMPLHVAAQPRPGTREAALEAECKARMKTIARARGAKLIDWDFPSPITSEDSNYWDGLHYRVPIARRIARELAAAVLQGQDSSDGSYRRAVP